MAEGRRSGSGGGQGRSSGGRGPGGRGASGGGGRTGGKPAGKSGGRTGGKPLGKSGGKGAGKPAGKGSGKPGTRSGGSSTGTGGGRAGGARTGGGRTGGTRSEGASSGGTRSGGARTGGPRAGSGRPSSGRPSSGRPSSGRPSSGRPSSGRSTDRRDTGRPERTGGFGPHNVDQRDEETRARRNQPRDDSRGAGRGDSRGRGRDRRDADRGDDTDERRPSRPALRVVGTRKPAKPKSTTARKATPTKRGAGKITGKGTGKKAQGATKTRRRRRGPAGVQEEMAQLAGRDASRALGTLMAAADAYSHDREREAIRILRPLRDRMPGSQSVRELMGLSQYRVGNYNAAAKELEAYAELSGELDQHPVLMDCYRAQHRWKKVADLWEELAAVSPSADVVTEGRIVYAGALADQDKLPEALALLRKRGEPVKQPKDHHLRVWYALADLEERAGNLARARELFHQVARVEPGFSDVAERLAALG